MHRTTKLLFFLFFFLLRFLLFFDVGFCIIPLDSLSRDSRAILWIISANCTYGWQPIAFSKAVKAIVNESNHH